MKSAANPYRSPHESDAKRTGTPKPISVRFRLVVVAGAVNALLGYLAIAGSFCTDDLYMNGWYGEQTRATMLVAKAHSINLLLLGALLFLVAVVVSALTLRRRRTVLGIVGLLLGSFPFLWLMFRIVMLLTVERGAF